MTFKIIKAEGGYFVMNPGLEKPVCWKENLTAAKRAILLNEKGNKAGAPLPV